MRCTFLLAKYRNDWHFETAKIALVLRQKDLRQAHKGIKRICDGVEAETRKSQASFQIIQVSSEALPRMRLE